MNDSPEPKVMKPDAELRGLADSDNTIGKVCPMAKLSFYLGLLSTALFTAVASCVRSVKPPLESSDLLIIMAALLACFFTAIAATVIGSNVNPAYAGKRLARAGAILGYVNLAILLTVIVVPNFIKARPTSSKNACINNLRQLVGAKTQWAVENRKTGDDTPAWADLIGTNKYIKVTPSCPAGGEYTLGSLSVRPACSLLEHSLQLFEDETAKTVELTCQQSLVLLQVAKRQWLVFYPGQGMPTDKALKAYMRQVCRHSPQLRCEAGGAFIIGALNEKPRCSIPAHAHHPGSNPPAGFTGVKTQSDSPSK